MTSGQETERVYSCNPGARTYTTPFKDLDMLSGYTGFLRASPVLNRGLAT